MSFKLLETMRFHPEHGYYLLDPHLRRMKKSALFFGFKIDVLDIQEILFGKAEKWEEEKRVRLLLDRFGTIKLDYSSLHPKSESVIKVSISKESVHQNNVFLFHKTTNRDVYNQAISCSKDADDIILYNQHGEITESCIANIAIEIEGTWVTPPVCCGLLAGTKRADLIDKNQLVERIFYKEDLINTMKIKLFNSVRGEYLVELI